MLDLEAIRLRHQPFPSSADVDRLITEIQKLHTGLDCIVDWYGGRGLWAEGDDPLSIARRLREKS